MAKNHGSHRKFLSRHSGGQKEFDTDRYDLDDLSKSLKKLRFGKRAQLLFRLVIIFIIICLGTGLFVARTSAGSLVNIANSLRGGRYLVLFANNAELRPGGGFIGSFAIVDTRNLKPKIEYFETNIYKHDNQFTANNFVAMPEPLAKVLGADKSWQLHDSNWNTDFPTAAATSLWFYNKEYNDKLDGVILVCATSVRDILALTGPVSSPNTNLTLNYDNFFPVLSNAIEKEYWEDPRNEDINEPKTILKDYIPSLENKISSLPKWQLLSFIQRTVERKDILFYSTDKIKQKFLEENNYAGDIKTDVNFIYIANAAVGTKNSLAINQDAIYNIDPTNNVATLNITRTHNGKTGDYDGGVNTNYTIVHLPKGFDITDVKAGGKDVNIDKSSLDNYETFGFWTNINPGESVNITALITMPVDYNFSKLFVIKQPGSANEKLTINYFNNSISTAVDKDTILNLP